MTSSIELAALDDCGCGKSAKTSGVATMDDQLPTPNDLDASLEAALTADLAAPSDAGLGGPELTDPLIDELALGSDVASEEGLQYLVKLAEQYPGLKITLSFG